MTTPFGLADAPFFDERPDRPELFPDRPLEFFCPLAEPLDDTSSSAASPEEHDDFFDGPEWSVSPGLPYVTERTDGL